VLVTTPIWAREQRKRRTTLSREAIVRTAMAIADAEDLDAVSIRRVAADLGARAMSIYTYIERKEDLFALMADEVAGEVLVPGPLPADWREATLAIARRERAAVQRHPWMIDLAARRSLAGQIGPRMLRHLEQSIAALDTLDVDDELKYKLIAAVSDYTTGFVVREARERAQRAATDELDAYLRQVAADGEFPHVSKMLSAGPPTMEDNNFEQGLVWLMDGLAT
jgi:AcrR family transcriptional regulator